MTKRAGLPPGASGNPAGRPKGSLNRRTKEGVERALVDIDLRWESLRLIAEDADHPRQFEAIKLILAYAHGKPKTPAEISVTAEPDLAGMFARLGSQIMEPE